jgi:hypothetical protein
MVLNGVPLVSHHHVGVADDFKRQKRLCLSNKPQGSSAAETIPRAGKGNFL